MKIKIINMKKKLKSLIYPQKIHTALLQKIESTNKTRDSNDSLEEILGYTIYVKKDESTYIGYIYIN